MVDKFYDSVLFKISKHLNNDYIYNHNLLISQLESKPKMPTIERTFEMNATPEQVFDALVNPDTIQIWSKDEAKMGADVGASFTLWGGQMYGVNLEVIKNKKLVQKWCYDQWEEPSKVTFTIKSKGKKTFVELLHEDVPEKSLKSIDEGWNSYYLGAMQDMFEEVR